LARYQSGLLLGFPMSRHVISARVNLLSARLLGVEGDGPLTGAADRDSDVRLMTKVGRERTGSTGVSAAEDLPFVLPQSFGRFRLAVGAIGRF
jgi:hypothetical protein